MKLDPVFFGAVGITCAAILACGSEPAPSTPQSGGGSSGKGGASGAGSGGASASGGAVQSGGAPSSGGAVGSGGAPSGGAPGSGGGAGCDAASLCGGQCRDLATDRSNCGACGVSCAADHLCVGGVCACAAGRTECAGSCIDTQSDLANCGACSNACGANLVCSGGQCAGMCASHLTPCSGTCADLNGSSTNCGMCGNACPTDQSCSAGTCRCRTGQASCNGGPCQDVFSDEQNCGTCGNVCPAGSTCTMGSCACPAGQTACPGACRDLLADEQNCGTCGNICPSGRSCLDGACLDPSSVNCGGGSETNRTCVTTQPIDVGKYWVNNNHWGASSGSGTQCVWRTCQTGDLVGWGTEWNWTGQSNAVKSYASLIFGWQWGWRNTSTGLPVQISANRSIECGWAFNVQASGTFNVAYDLYAHTLSNPGTNDDPTDEIMIWLYRAGGAGPIGEQQGTTTLAGTTWNLHRGSNNRWNVISFVRATNATTQVLNVRDFMNDLVMRNWITSSKYLSSIQAGTEVFVGSSRLDTTGFYCRMP